MSKLLLKITNKFKKIMYVGSEHGLLGLQKLLFGFIEKKFFRKNVNFISLQELNFGDEFSENMKVLTFKKKFETTKLSWIVPDFGIGSGGHINIFRFISFLEKNGIENNIYMYGALRYKNAKIIKDTINTHFTKLKANVHIWEGSVEDSSAVVATSWDTAYPAAQVHNVYKRLYFIQDFEPLFFPASTESILAENTYKMGFIGICAGAWLADKLKTDYGMETYSYSFASEPEYKKLPLTLKKNNRILFYARPPTPRRGFDLGILALKLFHATHPEVEVSFAGWDTRGYKIPFPCNHLGNIDIQELPKIYAKHDACLLLSLTNCSLLPTDLMCSSCICVTNKGKNNEWLVNNKNGMLSEPNPRAISETLGKIYDNEKNRQNILKSAYQFAINRTWEQEYEKVLTFFKNIH